MTRRFLPGGLLVALLIAAGFGFRGCKTHTECADMRDPATCQVVQP